MIPINVIDEMHAALQAASQASALRRGPHTLANNGDLIDFLEQDLVAYRNAAVGMNKHDITMTEYCLYNRLLMLSDMGFILNNPPPVGAPAPLFIAAEIDINFIALLHRWKAAMKAPNPQVIHFGQMRANINFQGAIIGLSPRENALANQPVSNTTAAQLGHGLGCRVTVARLPNNQYIAVNNRTYAAHTIANAKPLRLVLRDATQAELNRLTEVEGVQPFAAFNFTPLAPRPAGTPNPRTLPSNWIPLENHAVPAQVVSTPMVPAAWTYM